MSEEVTGPQRCCDEYEEFRHKQWSLRHTRRDFLKTTVGAMAVAPMFPHMLLNSALAQRASTTPSTDPILVIVQLLGGNDGLNTIVPYGSDLYYKDRPTIGVAAQSVIPIDKTVGFHPNLKGFKSLYDQGKVAIVQGAGYANSSLSHFQGTTIWESADPTGESQTGWIGRFLDREMAGQDNPLAAIALGPMLPMTFLSQRSPVTSLENVNTYRFFVERSESTLIMNAFNRMYAQPEQRLPPYMSLVRAAGLDAKQGVQDLQAVSTTYKPAVQYPKSILGGDLQLVAQIISAGLGTRVFHVTLGGFDDHVVEVYTHARLLQFLGDAVDAFFQDLTAQGKADRVLMMTFSEFGRRVKENAGRGTDHGTAAPMFVIGNKVKGGMYGQDPILSALDNNGDLVYDIDFRSVYGTILDGWLGGNSTSVLGSSFERVPFL